jgi:hypothetical protein
MRRWIPLHIRKKIALRRLADDRTAEQRRCAIVSYDTAFAVSQEWHEQWKRRENIRKLRGAFKKEAA